MEYFRDPNNRIQADLAYRLGCVSRQYAMLQLPPDQNFAISLDVCILQNLLTNCVELVKAMSRHERRASYFRRGLSDSPPWGLSPRMIISNSFRNSCVTAEDVLHHLRNAMSHPTCVNADEIFPSTGYTTRPGPSNMIDRFVFVASPDTKHNRPRIFKDRESADEHIRRGKREGSMHDDVEAAPHEGAFTLMRAGKPYARLCIIEMTTSQLHALVLGLSNHLAQPIQEAWDGHTISQLFA